MPNYEKSFIYKLCCVDSSITDIYIGSTTNFRNRKSHHKSSTNNILDKEHNNVVYTFIRDHGGFENWNMIQIEEYNAKNKRDLESREQYFKDIHKPTLNVTNPIGSDESRYIYQKRYNEKNNEKIKQQKKEYDKQKREIAINNLKESSPTDIDGNHIQN